MGCPECWGRREKDAGLMPVCPLCRADFPDFSQSWAQYNMGCMHFYGQGGYPVDTMKGLSWWRLAKDQRFPPVLFQLAEAEECKSEAFALYKRLLIWAIFLHKTKWPILT